MGHSIVIDSCYFINTFRLFHSSEMCQNDYYLMRRFVLIRIINVLNICNILSYFMSLFIIEIVGNI